MRRPSRPVRQTAHALLELRGVGVQAAAALLVAAGDNRDRPMFIFDGG